MALRDVLLQDPCSDCGGKGRRQPAGTPCPTCSGTGRVARAPGQVARRSDGDVLIMEEPTTAPPNPLLVTRTG